MKKQYKMHEELIKIAKKDLQASKILYRNKLYPQAVFYSQQSVEKLNKALGLIMGQVKEEDLQKEIGHISIKIHEKITREQLERYQKFKQLLDSNPTLKSIKILGKIDIEKKFNEMDLLLSEFKKIKNEKDKILRLSSKEIISYIQGVDNLSKELKEERKNLSKMKVTKESLDEMKQYLLEVYSYLGKYNPENFKKIGMNDLKKLDVKIMKKLLMKFISLISITAPLYLAAFYLAIITFPHSTITRYPQERLTPLKIYTKKLPLVKLLPKLIKIQDETISGIKRYLIK